MTAKQNRDAVLEQVADNAGQDFFESVEELLKNFHDSEVTGEDVRLYCEARQLRPHHHNAWGATIAKLVKRGVLVFEGERRSMTSKKSHARETKVYRVTCGEESNFEWLVRNLKTARSMARLEFLACAIKNDIGNGFLTNQSEIGRLRKLYAQQRKTF